MQVSVENLEGLERKLTITVGGDIIDKAVDKKLNEFAKTARIDGFRPGKIPKRILQERFAQPARQEAMSDIVQDGYQQAIDETKIVPAGMPKIDFVETDNDKELIFTAIVEVYPQVELTDMASYEVEQESVDISEEDVDAIVENLKTQKATWKDVKRKAKKDDQLTIDFVGSIDGEEFEGGKAEGSKIIIGSKSMIAGFETGLKGLKTGETATITCTFPKKYQAENLAGKEAEFAITVHNVEAPEAVEIDEAFIKDFGVEDGTVESFRAEIRSNMDRELGEALKNKNKKNVMDAILANHKVETPTAMVAEEIKALKENMKQYTQQQGELDDALFADEAKRRVSLGLIISKIIETEKFTADEAKVKEAVDNIAEPYNDSAQVVDYYYSQPNMLKNVEAMVIEEAVVELVVSKAKVSVVVKKYQDIIEKR